MSTLTHPLLHPLERIMTDALEDHAGSVSIGGRTIINLRFADDINGLAGEEKELANLVERLDKASTAYGIKISAEKTKLMTNNTSGINTEIKVNGQKLETVTSFMYLGSVITEPRYLKLVTVSSFCPFTLISVLTPLVSFVISLVFSALISMPHPSSRMLVKHGPSQQSSKEEYKPWK